MEKAKRKSESFLGSYCSVYIFKNVSKLITFPNRSTVLLTSRDQISPSKGPMHATFSAQCDRKADKCIPPLHKNRDDNTKSIHDMPNNLQNATI